MESTIVYRNGVRVRVASDYKTNPYFYLIHTIILNYIFSYIIPLGKTLNILDIMNKSG